MKRPNPKKRRTSKRKARQDVRDLPSIPSVRRLIAESWEEIVTFRRQLLGVTAVYAVLFMVATQGFTLSLSVSATQKSIADFLGESASIWDRGSNLFLEVVLGNQLAAKDSATSTIQMILAIFATLALIWSLRRVRELQKVSVKEAYYKGTAPFVSFGLTILLLSVLSIPFSLSSMFTFAATEYGSTNVILGSAVVTFVVFVVTIYGYLRLWPSLFIVSLGYDYPVASIRKAWLLTRYRSWAIVRKIVGYAMCASMVFLGTVLLCALTVPAITLGVFVAMSFVTYLFTVVYLFFLYRSMV